MTTSFIVLPDLFFVQIKENEKYKEGKTFHHKASTVTKHRLSYLFFLCSCICKEESHFPTQPSLPGQFSRSLQVLVCRALPTQFLPPLAGTGLLHWRDRDWDPLPHVLEHELQLPHALHPPLTARRQIKQLLICQQLPRGIYAVIDLLYTLALSIFRLLFFFDSTGANLTNFQGNNLGWKLIDCTGLYKTKYCRVLEKFLTRFHTTPFQSKQGGPVGLAALVLSCEFHSGLVHPLDIQPCSFRLGIQIFELSSYSLSRRASPAQNGLQRARVVPIQKKSHLWKKYQRYGKCWHTRTWPWTRASPGLRCWARAVFPTVGRSRVGACSRSGLMAATACLRTSRPFAPSAPATVDWAKEDMDFLE